MLQGNPSQPGNIWLCGPLLRFCFAETSCMYLKEFSNPCSRFRGANFYHSTIYPSKHIFIHRIFIRLSSRYLSSSSQHSRPLMHPFTTAFIHHSFTCPIFIYPSNQPVIQLTFFHVNIHLSITHPSIHQLPYIIDPSTHPSIHSPFYPSSQRSFT